MEGRPSTWGPNGGPTGPGAAASPTVQRSPREHRSPGRDSPTEDQAQHSEQQRPPRKRRRPAVACVRCRRRKIRCDREQPCAHCQRARDGTECVYTSDTEAPLPKNNSKPTAKSSHGTASGVSSEHNGKDAPGRRQHSSGPQSPDQASIPDGVKHMRKLQQQSIEEEELMKRVDRLEEFLVKKPSNPLASDLAIEAFAKNFDVRGTREVISKSRFFGRSHWSNTFGQFNNAAQIDVSQLITDDNLCNLILKCKDVARDIKAQRFGKPRFQTADLLALIPTKATADKLTHLYLTVFERFVRILHIPTFYRDYERFWARDIVKGTVNESFVVILLLAMATAASFDKEESSRILATQWIAAAQLWLNGPSEKQKLNLSQIQIFCLLISARQLHNVGGDLVWIPAGSLIRLAMTIGLNRDPKFFPHMSPFQSEMRRRLWATVIELDIQASLDAGMPPLMSLDDYDCEAPLHINDSDIDEDTKVMPKARPESEYTQMSVCLALLQSFKTRLSIVKLVNNFRRDPTDEEVMMYTERLGTILKAQAKQFDVFHRSQPKDADIDAPTSPGAFNKALLDIFTRRFLLVLLLPYAITMAPEPKHHFFRKSCVDCALIFINYFYDDIFCTDPDDQRQRLRSAGGGMLQDNVIHSAIIVAMELINQASSGDFLPTSMSDAVRKPLRKAFDDINKINSMRMYYGETNAKGFMYFGIVKSRLDSLDSPEDFHGSIIEIARERAEGALEVLKERSAKCIEAAEIAGRDRYFPETPSITLFNDPAMLSTSVMSPQTAVGDAGTSSAYSISQMDNLASGQVSRPQELGPLFAKPNAEQGFDSVNGNLNGNVNGNGATNINVLGAGAFAPDWMQIQFATNPNDVVNMWPFMGWDDGSLFTM